MTDKDFKATVKRVRAFVRKWKFLTKEYDLDITYRRTAENDTYIGQTWGQWQYKQGTIWFYIPNCLSCTEDVLEKAVVHEFVHILMSSVTMPKRDQDKKEFATETIAQAIIATRLKASPRVAVAKPQLSHQDLKRP
jgi:hypothetical protein